MSRLTHEQYTLPVKNYLAKVKLSFDENRFFEGDCHNLAVALYRQFGQNTGSLMAIMRYLIDDDDNLCSTTYSHMVFVDERMNEWDISGDDASRKWEELWPDYPDKHGYTNEFETVDLSLDDVQNFLKEHDCKLDEALINDLLAI